MTGPIRTGVLQQPSNAPDFATWRSAVLHAEELGADLIFAPDHLHRPQIGDVNHARRDGQQSSTRAWRSATSVTELDAEEAS